MTRKKPVKKIGWIRKKKLPGHLLQSRRLKLFGDKWARGDTLRNRQYLKQVERAARKFDPYGDDLKHAVAQIDEKKEGRVVHMDNDESFEEEEKDAARAEMEQRHQAALFFLAARETDAARNRYNNLETLADKEAFLIRLERVFKATAERCRDMYREKLNGVNHIRDVLALLFLIADGKESVRAIRTIFCRRRGFYDMKQIRAGDVPGAKKYYTMAREYVTENPDRVALEMKIHDLLVIDKADVSKWADPLSCRLWQRKAFVDERLEDYDAHQIQKYLKDNEHTHKRWGQLKDRLYEYSKE